MIEDNALAGIVTMSDIAKAIGDHKTLDEPVREVMTTDVVIAPSTVQLFEVIRRFKERDIGRLVVMEGDRPVGILTQSDIIRQFPTL